MTELREKIATLICEAIESETIEVEDLELAAHILSIVYTEDELDTEIQQYFEIMDDEQDIEVVFYSVPDNVDTTAIPNDGETTVIMDWDYISPNAKTGYVSKYAGTYEEALAWAIGQEDYEEAAKLRDAIRKRNSI